jgi:branched-chain amino acid transport system permease protein
VDWPTLWQVMVETVALASIYALVAVGFVVIFRATGLFNFAQGQFMAIAGYVAVAVQQNTGLGYAPTALLVMVILFGIGALTYILLLRPLLGYPLWAPVMVTLGLAIVIDSIIDIVWLQDSYELDWIVPVVGIDVGWGAVIANVAIANILITIGVFLLLELTLTRTRYGIRLQAAAENPLLAGLSGIRVPMYFALAWGIAGAAAALGGLGYSTIALVSPTLVTLGLRAFPAALVGGMDSVRGAAAGALLVALAEVIGVRVFGAAAADAIVFLILIVTLTLRPYGLFGSREVARV